jgi:cytochrome c-type biogenesis protein CcmF
MEYIGENLLAGTIGNFFVAISIAFGLLSTVAYFLAENRKSEEWRKLGRIGFRGHSIGILGIVITLFTMIFNQYFEYHYVWQHSSSDMPLRFIFSCFWEGQEGSFILWMFWHVVLGNILIFTSKSWENGVMTVFSSVQVILSSMLLGIYIFEYKLGSNPFTVLLREHPDFADLPIFQIKDYTANLDGRGLNPLLQNYWMTIHPPTLFLGFASTLVPFAYAIAALWKRDYIGWVKPAISWTFFGIGVLGVGILMGGVWAYEALSFGGFWAWDPVENASLVPWLTMVAAGHLMLIQRKKGTSVLSLFIFTTLTFCLILYSTFLTRSGVLGDSSVHAFTDLGMSGQLLFYLVFYVILSIVMIAFHAKKFPGNDKDESIWSREFWMFIGSLFLFISAFQIIFSTSFPVINKIFGTNFAQSAERIEYYNKWQMPIAIIVALIVSIGQFLKYKETKPLELLKNLSVSLVVSALVTVFTAIFMEITNPFVLMLLFTSTMAITANLDYWIRILSGKFRLAGPSIAHVGFGMILLGALISTSQSDVISENTSLYDVSVLGEDFNNNENILLMKDDTLMMGDYSVSYRGKRKEGIFIHYEVDYMQGNAKGELENVFTLYPFVQLNPRMGNVAEPYTKHYLDQDVYTHITYAELEERKSETKSEEHSIQLGDTIFGRNSFMVLDSLNREPNKERVGLTINDLALGAKFTVYDVETQARLLEPMFVIRDRSFSFSVPDSVPDLGIKLSFKGIDPETASFKFNLEETDPELNEFIVMKAIVFPGINILWAGIILMGLGTFIAVFNRARRKS